jgi:hypothetical protein
MRYDFDGSDEPWIQLEEHDRLHTFIVSLSNATALTRCLLPVSGLWPS